MSGPFTAGHKVFNTDLNPILLGWVDFSWFGSTLAYVSADAPTFVFSVNADVTTLIEAGMRIKLTQTTDKFFIVTAVGAYSAGVTPITVYGGTDYTLANAAISAGSFSTHKKPYGFNASPAKWTQELNDTSDRATATPTSGVWGNPGGLLLSFPIGAWNAEYSCVAYDAQSAGNQSGFSTTLSTANNSESDRDLTAHAEGNALTANLSLAIFRRKLIVVTVKTSYFLNIKATQANSSSVQLRGSSDAPSIVRAVCAYL